MITAHDVGVNLRALDGIAQRCRHHQIVDSPSDVARPRIGEVTPPRIVAVALCEEPERIDEACIDEGLKTGALFIGKTLLAAIWLGVRKIKLGMGHVQVAAKYDGFGFSQVLAVGEKRRIPMLMAQRQPAQVVLGVGRVHRDDKKFCELSGDDPALLRAVALQFIGESKLFGEVDGKAVDDFRRLLLGKYRRSRVTFLQRRVPVLAVIGQLDFNLPPLGLGLLEAQNVGVVSLEKCEKQALLMHGTNAVHVPRKNLHLVGLARQPAPKALYTAISEVAASVRLCESSNSALKAVRSASSTSRKSMRPPSKRLCARSAALSLAAAATCRASRRGWDRPRVNRAPPLVSRA